MNKVIPLSMFEYVPKLRQLRIASEPFGMPSELFIKSHHTDRVVRFVPLNEKHPMFSQDCWDGEQMMYEPAPGEYKTKVETVVIYNQY